MKLVKILADEDVHIAMKVFNTFWHFLVFRRYAWVRVEDLEPEERKQTFSKCGISGRKSKKKQPAGLGSQVVFSKQPKLGLMQELSFSRISESTTGYTFTPCVGSFTSPGIDTR